MAKSVNKIRTSGLELWTLRSWSSPSFLSKNSKLWGSQRSPCQLPVALKVASLCELSELGHTSRPFSRDLPLFSFVCWPPEHLHSQNFSLFDHMTLIRYNQQPSYLKHSRYLKFFDQLKISEGWQKGRKKSQSGRQARGENHVHGVSEELAQSPPGLDDHRHHQAALVPRKEVQTAPHILHP